MATAVIQNVAKPWPGRRYDNRFFSVTLGPGLTEPGARDRGRRQCGFLPCTGSGYILIKP